MFDNYDEILTIEQLMELLCIGRNKAYELLNTGEIKGFKIGRVWKIPRQMLDEFIIDRTAEYYGRINKEL